MAQVICIFRHVWVWLTLSMDNKSLTLPIYSLTTNVKQESVRQNKYQGLYATLI